MHLSCPGQAPGDSRLYNYPPWSRDEGAGVMDARDLDTLLRLLPLGSANGTNIPALGELMYPDAKPATRERMVREGIEQLVNDRRVPVASSPKPYSVFIALTAEELAEVDEDLRSRAMALLRRRRSIRLCREELTVSPALFGRAVA